MTETNVLKGKAFLAETAKDVELRLQKDQDQVIGKEYRVFTDPDDARWEYVLVGDIDFPRNWFFRQEDRVYLMGPYDDEIEGVVEAGVVLYEPVELVRCRFFYFTEEYHEKNKELRRALFGTEGPET